MRRRRCAAAGTADGADTGAATATETNVARPTKPVSRGLTVGRNHGIARNVEKRRVCGGGAEKAVCRLTSVAFGEGRVGRRWRVGSPFLAAPD